MAFHHFKKTNVSTAVIECGVGGEYDSTNVLPSPKVTGITSLGIDHTAMLGNTIEEIAWHKAGIMKIGTPAFTVAQPSGAMRVLQNRAFQKQVELKTANVRPEIESGSATLGVEGEFQKTNAGLAVELATSYLHSVGLELQKSQSLPKEFLHGLENVRWAGRCEAIEESDLLWHIDGAHTKESIRIVAEWFKSRTLTRNTDTPESPAPLRILLFNQQTRDAAALLRELRDTLADSSPNAVPFTHAIFCSNVTFANSGYKADLVSVNISNSTVEDLSVQKDLADGWKRLVPSGASNTYVVKTIEDAVAKCRSIAKDWKLQGSQTTDVGHSPVVLATGSLHLVGGLLEVLKR